MSDSFLECLILAALFSSNYFPHFSFRWTCILVQGLVPSSDISALENIILLTATFSAICIEEIPTFVKTRMLFSISALNFIRLQHVANFIVIYHDFIEKLIFNSFTRFLCIKFYQDFCRSIKYSVTPELSPSLFFSLSF